MTNQARDQNVPPSATNHLQKTFRGSRSQVIRPRLLTSNLAAKTSRTILQSNLSPSFPPQVPVPNKYIHQCTCTYIHMVIHTEYMPSLRLHSACCLVAYHHTPTFNYSSFLVSYPISHTVSYMISNPGCQGRDRGHEVSQYNNFV